MSTPIPYAAYAELQARFFSIVSQEVLGFQPNLLIFSEALMAIPEDKRLALLNCMMPNPVTELGAPENNPPRAFLSTLVYGHPQGASNPLNPQNDIPWNRLLDLSERHPQVKRVMDGLVAQDFTDFTHSFNQDRCARRISHCPNLEYQTSDKTHVRCPESQRWMHQSVFFRQFSFNAISFGQIPQNHSEYGGSLQGLMNDIGRWLTTLEDGAMVSLHHFDYPMARGEYEDGRIKWSFKGTGNPAFEQLGLISSSRFYAVAEAMAKDCGLNNNRRAFLDSDLSL